MPPNNVTQEIKAKTTKIEHIKAWAPIITAIIALIGMVVVALISASSSKVNGVIDRLDQKLIPKLEEKIDKLEIKLAELDVYRKVFEKEIDKLHNKSVATGPVESVASKVIAAKANVPKAEKFELPRVQMEQRITPVDVAARE